MNFGYLINVTEILLSKTYCITFEEDISKKMKIVLDSS